MVESIFSNILLIYERGKVWTAIDWFQVDLEKPLHGYISNSTNFR